MINNPELHMNPLLLNEINEELKNLEVGPEEKIVE